MPLSVPSRLASAASRANDRPWSARDGAAPGDQPQTVEFDRDVGAHERHRLAVGDRLAERVPLLDIGDHVIQHRVGGADGQRRPAEPGQCDSFRVVLVRRGLLTETRGQWHSHIVEFDPAQRRGADPHARVGLDGKALRRRFDDEHRRLAIQLRCHYEQFRFLGGHHQRLHAVEAVAARRANGRRLQRGRVEQRTRFGDRQAGLRHILARELGEVGGLLVGTAPMGEGRCDTGRRQDRQRQSHVPVGERLGNQRVRHGGTVFGDAVEILWDVDRGDAQFVGLGDEIRWVACFFVSIAGSGPKNLFCELADGLDDHLLVVVRRQVEVVGSAGLQSRRAALAAGHLLELTVGGADDREDLFHAVLQSAVERIAQVVPVQELLADDRSDQRQADIGRGPLVLVGVRRRFPARSFSVRAPTCGRLCWSFVCSLAQ